MYYILKIDRQTDKDVILKGTLYNSDQEVVGSIFDAGTTLKDKIKVGFTIIIDETNTTKGKLTDKLAGSVADAGFIFIINKKVKEVFDNLKIKNIEYYALHIKGKDIDTKEYLVANVVGKIDCIDLEKSEIKYSILKKTSISRVGKLVFDETKIPKDLKIFLLGQFTLAEFVLHKDVKEAIEAVGITGFTFVSVEDFTK